MKDIKCFVFDFGNVVAFFDHRQACRQLAKLTGDRWSAEDIYKKLFQLGGLEEQYDRGRITTPKFLTEIKREFNITADEEKVAEAWCDIFWLNKHMLEILRRLKERSFRLILASNTNELHHEWFADRFKSDLLCFDDVFVSYKIGHRKPEREFFDYCLEKAECHSSQCVYVDDREDFVDVSCELGMNGVVVDDLIYELEKFGILENLRFEDFDLPAIRPTIKLQAKETDRFLALYKEKYANYRHFDTLRWQIPGLVFVVGGVLVGFAPRKELIYPEPWVLVLYGPFVLLCAWLMARFGYHMKLNTVVLRAVAMKLGDHSIPISPGKLGAVYWIEKFLWALGLLATVTGAYLKWKYIGAIATVLVLLAIIVLQRVKWKAWTKA